MSFLGWILFLIVAAICATIAAALVPGKVPGGLLPAILGSAVLVFGIALLSGALGGRD